MGGESDQMPEKLDVQSVLRDFKANRNHAAAVATLSRGGDPDLIYKIKRAYGSEKKDFGAKEVLLHALGRIGKSAPQAVHLLGEITRAESEWTLKRTAVELLGDSGSEAASQYLEERAADNRESRSLRVAAQKAIDKLRESGAAPPKPALPAHLFRTAGEKPLRPAAPARPAAPPAPPSEPAPRLPPQQAPASAPAPGQPPSPLPAATPAQRTEGKAKIDVAALTARSAPHEIRIEEAFMRGRNREKMKAAGISTLGQLVEHTRRALRLKTGLTDTDLPSVTMRLKRFGLKLRATERKATKGTERQGFHRAEESRRE